MTLTYVVHSIQEHYLLVAIDEYSRFPEVEITTSTSANYTIPKLDKIFSINGIPEVVKSDNGPPFQTSKFKYFAEQAGFQHQNVHKLTAMWRDSCEPLKKQFATQYLKERCRGRKYTGFYAVIELHHTARLEYLQQQHSLKEVSGQPYLKIKRH